MSGLLTDAGWQVFVLLLLLGYKGEGSFVFPKEEEESNSFNTETKCKKERRVFEEKNAPTVEKSRQEVSEEETKSPGKALTVRRHHPSPAPSSERHKVISDHCWEGEGGAQTAHAQPAGCGYSCFCAGRQEGDDLELQVLLKPGVEPRPSCDV